MTIAHAVTEAAASSPRRLLFYKGRSEKATGRLSRHAGFQCGRRTDAGMSSYELGMLVVAELLWAFVGFVVLASVVHGTAASPVMTVVDRYRPLQDETNPDA